MKLKETLEEVKINIIKMEDKKNSANLIHFFNFDSENSSESKGSIEGIDKNLLKKIGILKQDVPMGDFWNDCHNFCNQRTDFLLEEADEWIEKEISIRNDEDMRLLQISGKITSWLMNKMIDKIETIIDDSKQEKHSTLSKEVSNLVEGSMFKKFCADNKLDPESVEITNRPMIQSGGNYNFNMNNPDDDILADRKSVV